MSIITLISDWNKSDYYSGIVKGIIKYKCPDTNIIDISHNIERFNYAQAGFIAKHTTKHFPKETIHIIAVNSEATKEHKHIVVKNANHYYIFADNGIGGFIFSDKPELIIELETVDIQTSFPEAKIFAKIAAYIACGNDISELGIKKDDVYRQMPGVPAVDKNSITGMIIYNDCYGNAITNISKKDFINYGKNRKFDILLSNNNHRINNISLHYNDVDKGDKFAVFNSVGLMEIGINTGSVKDLLGLSKSVSIRIKFYD